MTEDEAKTKFCPMIESSKVQVGMDEWKWTEPKCRGSACMMWRPEHENSGAGVLREYADSGYCGLIGV